MSLRKLKIEERKRLKMPKVIETYNTLYNEKRRIQTKNV